MRKLYVLLIPIFLVYVGCTSGTSDSIDSEIEEPIGEHSIPKDDESSVYFTYYANETTTDSDNWIIIHDQSGNLLDFSSYEQGETLIFEQLNSNLEKVVSLNVTKSSHFSSNIDLNNFYTYVNIQKGAVWNLASTEESGINYSFSEVSNPIKKPSLINEKTIQNNITVSNIPGIKKYNITSPSTGVISADFNKNESSTLSLLDITLETDITYIIYVGDLQGNQKYLFFGGEESNPNLEFDYNDFLEFDNLIETNLPSNSYLFTVSRGYQNATALGRGYEMTVELDFGQPVLSQLGYISGFESYSTNFQITLDDYSYGYLDVGQIPTQIVIRDRPMFSVTNPSLNEFKFETNQEYKWSESLWEYSNRPENITYSVTRWSILNAKGLYSTIGSLPEEIVNKYPSLEIQKLSYNKTVLNITDETYQDFIDRSFVELQNRAFPYLFEYIVMPVD